MTTFYFKFELKPQLSHLPPRAMIHLNFYTTLKYVTIYNNSKLKRGLKRDKVTDNSISFFKLHVTIYVNSTTI